MADFTHPFLVLQGLADTVTDPALAKVFHDRAASKVGGGAFALLSSSVCACELSWWMERQEL